MVMETDDDGEMGRSGFVAGSELKRTLNLTDRFQSLTMTEKARARSGSMRRSFESVELDHNSHNRPKRRLISAGNCRRRRKVRARADELTCPLP